MEAGSVRATTCTLTSVTATPVPLVVTGVRGEAGEAAVRLVTAVKCDVTGPVTIPDRLTEDGLVPDQIHRSRDAAPASALSMVTGVPGSRGETVPPHVAVARELVSDSVTVRLKVMEADRVLETPPSCPGAARRPVQGDLRKLEGASSGTSTTLSLASPS